MSLMKDRKFAASAGKILKGEAIHFQQEQRFDNLPAHFFG